MFRKLRASEIDVRTQSVKDNGAILLLYKDARCDMNILDETVGAFNWKREHTRENANCIVSIWDADKEQWVSKEDTGTESNTEKAKGLASDSFKRACFNWGIGRELYTSPFIWVSGSGADLKYAQYKCDDIGYDENGAINRLVIKRVDRGKNEVVYTTEKKQTQQPKRVTTSKETKDSGTKATDKQLEIIKTLYTEEEIKSMLNRLKKDKVESLTLQEASTMISHKTKK